MRRHSWLPKCLRCSRSSCSTTGAGSGTGSGASGTSAAAADANGAKDLTSHNTSSNPSAPGTESSGLSSHVNSNVGSGVVLQSNNHSLRQVCAISNISNTNLSITQNLNNLPLSPPLALGPHQIHIVARNNHNRHSPNQQGIQIPLIHQTVNKKFASNYTDLAISLFLSLSSRL